MSGVVLAVYVCWLVVYFASGHGAKDFIHVGSNFVYRSNASPVIVKNAGGSHVSEGTGYDGQFSYYLALDPIQAHFYTDSNYRYTRILYPMLVRALALGRPTLIPSLLILVNLVSVAVGTFFLAAWLSRHGVSPTLALIYGLYPGLFMAFLRDLTDVLGYALIAVGAYAFDRDTELSRWTAAFFFGLAILARETTLVFPAIYAVSLLWAKLRYQSRNETLVARSLGSVGGFFLLAFGPMLVYRLLLLHWLGSVPLPADASPRLVPFQGIVGAWPWKFDQVEAVPGIIIPAFICGTLALLALRRDEYRPEIFMLIVNILLFVVMLNRASYADIFGSERTALGVIVAALLCVPVFDVVANGRRVWLTVSAAGWLLLAPFFLLVTPIWILLGGSKGL